MFCAMGRSKPIRRDLAPDHFPVRLAIRPRGRAVDPVNMEVSDFLQRRIGPGRFELVPDETGGGQRVIHVYLLSLWDAWALMMACPQLELVRDVYRGPVR